MSEIKLLDNDEIQTLRSSMLEMTLMIGLLRGIIFEHQWKISDIKKIETLKEIDKKIDCMFYKSCFIAKEPPCQK